MNNCATIIKINAIQKHLNADRLQIISLFGTQIITDMGTKQDDLMIYFDSNLKLSNDYCKNNNLFRTKELNIDQTKSGYIDDNCRVKAIKLKGEFSDGILMPLNSLDFINKLNINDLTQGYEFNDINGINICEKYIPVQQKSLNKQGDGKKKNSGRKTPKSPMFVEHWDTSQFFKNQHIIPVQTVLYLEEKIHGCVDGNTLIETLEFGKIIIREIVEKKLKCHVKSLNLETNEIEFVEVDDYYFYANDNDWYEIELENNEKLIITGNNPIWLPKYGCYRRTDLLTINDYLLVD